MYCIRVAEQKVEEYENCNKIWDPINGAEFLEQFLKEDLLHGVIHLSSFMFPPLFECLL